MTVRAKRRHKQRYRIIQMQEYILGLNRFDFAALLTVIDSLDEVSMDDEVQPWEPAPELSFWDKIKDKLLILDSYQMLDWNVLKRDIVYAIINSDVKVVFIDPLTSLTAAMSVSAANEFLQQFCPEVAKMAIDYDVAFVIPVHLKASESGIGHEEGGRVMLKELVGSRAMIRSGNVIMALEHPTKAESKEEKNVRILRILADRNLGITGGSRMYYNENTGKLEEFEVFD